jgi:pectate lyase
MNSTRDTRRRRRATGVAGITAVLVATAVGLVLATTMPAQAATLFFDDFEDGNANGWTTSGGSWSVVQDATKVLRQASSSSDARAIAGLTGIGAGPFTILQGTVKPTGSLGGSRAAALLTKVKDANTYYYLALRSGTLELGKRLNGAVTVLATTPFTPATGTWYSLTINTFFSDRVTGSVSGPAGSASVTALGAVGPEYGTKVGFWARSTSAMFDEIKLSDDRIVPTPSASVTTPPPSPSPSASASPSASPTPNPACQVTYTITPLNSSIFQALITIRNAGTTATNSWRLVWTFADGQIIQSPFNGQFTQVGPNVTVNSLAWNAVIAPGGSFSGLGFYGAWNGVTNSIPQITCLTT